MSSLASTPAEWARWVTSTTTQKHFGPGAHPGSGTPQAVHGGDDPVHERQHEADLEAMSADAIKLMERHVATIAAGRPGPSKWEDLTPEQQAAIEQAWKARYPNFALGRDSAKLAWYRYLTEKALQDPARLEAALRDAAAEGITGEAALRERARQLIADELWRTGVEDPPPEFVQSYTGVAWEQFGPSGRFTEATLGGWVTPAVPGTPPPDGWKRWVLGADRRLSSTADAERRATADWATQLVVSRALELAQERGLPGNADDWRRIGQKMWGGWLRSSVSPEGKAMMHAAGVELGADLGRLHPSWAADPNPFVAFPVDAASTRPGGQQAYVNTYVRALWDTTQYLGAKGRLLDSDGTVATYRGLMLDVGDDLATHKLTLTPVTLGEYEDEDDDTLETFKKYHRLVGFQLAKSPLQSTSYRRDVANEWNGVGDVPEGADRVVLRAKVPLTALLSLPIYGKNEQSEQELVVLGTTWVDWDTWLEAAPDARAHYIRGEGRRR